MRSALRVINSKGMSLVEVLLAVAIFTVLASGMFGAIIYGREGALISGQRARAAAIAKEGVEAVRNMSWNSLVDGSVNGLSSSGSSWAFSGSSDAVDNFFTRTVAINNVETSGNVMHKDVAVTVTWGSPARSVVQKIRLSSWQWSWQEGTREPTGTENVGAAQDGRKVKVLSGYSSGKTWAFIVTWASGNGTLYSYDVTDPTNPVAGDSATITGQPTNIDVGRHPTLGEYVVVGSASTSAELQWINVSNPAAMAASMTAINVAGSQAATSVAFDGQFAYMTRANNALANEFIMYELTGASTWTARGTSNPNVTLNDVVVLGTVAYFAVGNTSNEIRYCSFGATRANCTTTNLLDLPNAGSGPTSINGYLTSFYTGKYAVLLVGYTTNLYSLSITAATSGAVNHGAVAMGATVTDVTKDSIRNYGIAATSGTSNNQVRIINVSSIPTIGAPSDVKTLSTSTNTALNGLSYEPVLDRAFSAGAGDTSELEVFSPQ